MKLYRYRPLSDLLYKELFYQEIYFASYSELNDPLDLSARIEFTPTTIEEIETLLWFLFKSTIRLGIHDKNEVDNDRKLVSFSNNAGLRAAYKKEIFESLVTLSSSQNFISIEDLEGVLKSITVPFKINFSGFRKELDRLTRKFLENSCAACYSEGNDDFLMWAHYASKHSGICMEFTLENEALFPYIIKGGNRGVNKEEYLKRISHWETKEIIFWERIKKVKYQEEQPHINFFAFSPVFNNENDCDLIGLSKGWTHHFANELEHVFSTKTSPWQYEREWRSIRINFGDTQEPEDRTSHFPIECLSGIYFGLRTPELIKKRIYKIFKHYGHIKYFTCITTSGRKLLFDEWQYDVD